uniref:Uncharacterized protein n=1 Tax=Plectus sambesii TaxID=2011161 RepID=A0A914VHA4_9BILA
MRPPPPRYGSVVTRRGSSCPSASEIDHRQCWCPPASVYTAQQYSSLQRRPVVVDHSNPSELQKQQQQQQSWNSRQSHQLRDQLHPITPASRAFCVHCQRCRQQMNDAHHYVGPPKSTPVTSSGRSSNQRLTSIPSPSSPMPSLHSAIDCWRPQHAPTYNDEFVPGPSSISGMSPESAARLARRPVSPVWNAQPLTSTTAQRCSDCDDASGQRRRVMSAEEASTGAADGGSKQERRSTVGDLDSSRAQRAADTAAIDHTTAVAADVSFHPRRYDAVTIAASADLMQISAPSTQDNTMMIVQQQRSRRQPWSVDRFSPHQDTPNLPRRRVAAVNDANAYQRKRASLVEALNNSIQPPSASSAAGGLPPASQQSRFNYSPADLSNGRRSPFHAGSNGTQNFRATLLKRNGAQRPVQLSVQSQDPVAEDTGQGNHNHYKAPHQLLIKAVRNGLFGQPLKSNGLQKSTTVDNIDRIAAQEFPPQDVMSRSGYNSLSKGSSLPGTPVRKALSMKAQEAHVVVERIYCIRQVLEKRVSGWAVRRMWTLTDHIDDERPWSLVIESSTSVGVQGGGPYAGQETLKRIVVRSAVGRLSVPHPAASHTRLARVFIRQRLRQGTQAALSHRLASPQPTGSLSSATRLTLAPPRLLSTLAETAATSLCGHDVSVVSATRRRRAVLLLCQLQLLVKNAPYGLLVVAGRVPTA